MPLIITEGLTAHDRSFISEAHASEFSCSVSFKGLSGTWLGAMIGIQICGTNVPKSMPGGSLHEGQSRYATVRLFQGCCPGTVSDVSRMEPFTFYYEHISDVSVLALLPYSGNFQEIFDRHRWNIEWYWMMFQKDTVVKCWHMLARSVFSTPKCWVHGVIVVWCSLYCIGCWPVFLPRCTPYCHGSRRVSGTLRMKECSNRKALEEVGFSDYAYVNVLGPYAADDLFVGQLCGTPRMTVSPQSEMSTHRRLCWLPFDNLWQFSLHPVFMFFLFLAEQGK